MRPSTFGLFKFGVLLCSRTCSTKTYWIRVSNTLFQRGFIEWVQLHWDFMRAVYIFSLNRNLSRSGSTKINAIQFANASVGLYWMSPILQGLQRAVYIFNWNCNLSQTYSTKQIKCSFQMHFYKDVWLYLISPNAFGLHGSSFHFQLKLQS